MFQHFKFKFLNTLNAAKQMFLLNHISKSSLTDLFADSHTVYLLVAASLQCPIKPFEALYQAYVTFKEHCNETEKPGSEFFVIKPGDSVHPPPGKLAQLHFQIEPISPEFLICKQ